MSYRCVVDEYHREVTADDMAPKQKPTQTKKLMYDLESEKLYYKRPWRSRMKKAAGDPPQAYQRPTTTIPATHHQHTNDPPPAYQPPAYEESEDLLSTLEKTTDAAALSARMMPLSAMLGVTESNVWYCTADICDDEEDSYSQALADCPARALRIEVMFCTRLDLINRFMAAHDLLRDNYGVNYSAPEFQTKYQDNLLLNAVCFSAHSVLDYLLECAGRRLLMMPCGTPIFHGGTTLHMAIIRGCTKLVTMTMDNLEKEDRVKMLNSFGDGTFFSANDSCYRVPLLLALQTGQMEVFLDLVGYGADPLVKDPQNGNGTIHAITLYGLREPHKAVTMLHAILNHEGMKRWYCRLFKLQYRNFTQVEGLRMRQLLIKTENSAGYSPLTHAAYHGVYPMLQTLLNMESVYMRSLWTMGCNSYSLYSMTEVDPTVRDFAGSNRASVLELLLYERPEDDVPVLAMTPFRDLIRARWRSWRAVYISWGLWHLASIALYTLYSIHEQTNRSVNTTPSNGTVDNIAPVFAPELDFALSNPMVRMAMLINTWIIVSVYLLVTITDAARSLRLYVRGRLLWPGSGHYLVPWSVVWMYDDFNLYLAAFAILTALSLLGVIPRHDIHKAVTGFGIMAGWYFLLFFTRAFRHTSLFTVMTNRMIRLDLMRFSIIAVIHILSFGSCLIILLFPHLPDEVSSIKEAPQTMFLTMIGFSDLGFLDSPTTSWVAKVVGVAFVITATVMLLNLLIAAMGDTYAGISNNKDGIWLKMRVRSVLILDRFLCWDRLRRRMMGNGLIYSKEANIWFLEVDNTRGSATRCRKTQTLL